MHEYWMVTENCIGDKNNMALPGSLQWEKGSKITEHGTVDFYYSMLTSLKNDIRYTTPEPLGIKGKREKVLSVERQFNENMQRMLSVIGDLNNRSRWIQDLRGVESVTTPINQVGTSHRCLLDKDIEIMTTSDFYSDEYKIVLEETDKKRMATFQFELSKINESVTLLKMNIFMRKNPLLLLAFRLFMKKKMLKNVEQTMENLNQFLQKQESVSCHC
jgi:hypothetical protein